MLINQSCSQFPIFSQTEGLGGGKSCHFISFYKDSFSLVSNCFIFCLANFISSSHLLCLSFVLLFICFLTWDEQSTFPVGGE